MRKIVIVVLLLLLAPPAHAWGRFEQGVLTGVVAGAILTPPSPVYVMPQPQPYYYQRPIPALPPPDVMCQGPRGHGCYNVHPQYCRQVQVVDSYGNIIRYQTICQ